MNPHHRRIHGGAAVPLVMVDRGRKMRIHAIHGGHGLQGRLNAMGLVPGMEIEVVRNDHGGPLIVEVLGTRLMLGRGMAHKILVC